MPHTTDWYIKDAIIYHHGSGIITPDEIRKSMLYTNELIENSPRPLVHIINDVGDLVQGLSAIETLKVVREVNPHKRVGWTITLRESSMSVKMAVGFVASLVKARTRSFDTIGEVEDFLKQMDPTINWEEADKSVLVGLIDYDEI